MNPANGNRPFEGTTRKEVLSVLATVNIIAGTLEVQIDPEAREEIAPGAGPLTIEQIQKDLEMISSLISGMALAYLKASPEEWLAANVERANQ